MTPVVSKRFQHVLTGHTPDGCRLPQVSIADGDLRRNTDTDTADLEASGRQQKIGV